MANTYTLLLRHGGMVAPKTCSRSFKFDSMVDFACSKWYELNHRTFGFTYQIDDVDECFLRDDDDIASMFDLAYQYKLERIDVSLKVSNNGDGNGLVLYDDDLIDKCIQYNPVVVESEQRLILPGEPEPSSQKHLLSRGWRDLIREVGQIIDAGARIFRKCLIKHSIEEGYEFEYVRNNVQRVSAECKFKETSMCPWRISASKCCVGNRFMIRDYVSDHTCGVDFATASKTKFNSSVIIDLISDDIRNMPSISPVDVQSQVFDKFGVEISYYVAWKACEIGRGKIYGDHTDSYSHLPSYIAAAERSNPDSVFHLDVHPIKQNFRRMFFSFGACTQGFQYCRPVLMVDGTFLKGKHKGVLLSAVSKDGNEGLFPIAFAIVSEENDSNWEYFFHHLKVAVGTSRDLTFVSDRQHGIIAGVKKIFPSANHGFCYKHLTSNLKHQFAGVAKKKRDWILKLFADCAYATTKTEFDTCFDKLKEAGGQKIEKWLEDIPKESWSNAYFAGKRYGQMTSNGCESWNAQIRGERALPITKLVDGIRMLLMKQMAERRANAATWNTILCRHVDTKMKEYVQMSRSWVVRSSNENIWEVFSTPSAVVDLRAASCSCRLWQITCIPCVHAARVIFLKMGSAYEHVDDCYHTSTYLKSYSGAIIPFVIPEVDMTADFVGPPDYQARRGRPKKQRILSKGEKIREKIKCGNCKRMGHHNRKSCTMSAVEK